MLFALIYLLLIVKVSASSDNLENLEHLLRTLKNINLTAFIMMPENAEEYDGLLEESSISDYKNYFVYRYICILCHPCRSAIESIESTAVCQECFVGAYFS